MKILDRGYWISQHFYWQSMYHYLLSSAKLRSMTYFSACNPSIELGGMLHDRKTDIYSLLPKHIVPITTTITTKSAIDVFIKTNNLTYPFIIKPNVGIKGFKVSKINNEEELDDFFASNDVLGREWLFQEYLGHDKEFSVLFYRYPSDHLVGVSSFVEKTYPSVVGDGVSSLQKLIDSYFNPFLEKEEVLKKFSDKLASIPKDGEVVILEVIGNYSRGAKFHSRMEHVNLKMAQDLDQLLQNAAGLNFFRIDFKANSVKEFLEGNFKVVEINGAKSEPLHIYDKDNSFVQNVKIINNHWRILEEISREQKEAAVMVPSFKTGIKSLISMKKMTK